MNQHVCACVCRLTPLPPHKEVEWTPLDTTYTCNMAPNSQEVIKFELAESLHKSSRRVNMITIERVVFSFLFNKHFSF